MSLDAVPCRAGVWALDAREGRVIAPVWPRREDFVGELSCCVFEAGGVCGEEDERRDYFWGRDMMVSLWGWCRGYSGTDGAN